MTACGGGHRFEDVELAIEGLVPLLHVEIGDCLEHAVIEPDERARDAGELADGRLGGRGDLAVLAPMVVGPPGGEAARACLQCCAGEGAHLRDVFVGRDLARAIAHHIDTQCIVGDLGDDVDRVREIDRVHVLGERLPGEFQTFGEGGAGDVLDAFHELDQAGPIALADWGEADPAVADDAGRDAVDRRGHQIGIPRDLSVVVGVQVDEPGGDDRTGRVDGPRRLRDGADLHDHPVANPDVAHVPRLAGSIDDRAAANRHIEHPPRVRGFTGKREHGEKVLERCLRRRAPQHSAQTLWRTRRIHREAGKRGRRI